MLCVIPHNAGWPKGNGKAVGKFNAPTGQWKGDDAWRGGQPLALKMEADGFGCNAGFALGVAALDGTRYVAIDGDMLPAWLHPSGKHFGLMARPHILNYLAEKMKCANLLVRNTVAPRFMILVKVRNPGRKTVITFERTIEGEPVGKGEPFGKIEVLTAGQQAVISGTHHSGSTIYWSRINEPNKHYLAPQIDADTPIFDTVEQIAELILDAMQPFAEKAGITWVVNTEKHVSVFADPKTPEEAAPPSFDLWLDLIKRTPNPPTSDRSQWTNFWVRVPGLPVGPAEDWTVTSRSGSRGHQCDARLVPEVGIAAR